ncbi:hypothetical protein LAJLEIBI_03016 [[Clostridium] hylemonae DSM 15053]|nr:hypothetical protein LAJLEIBI_03016 [[Clostridium] hylemonae DSM 15053]
MLLQSGTLEERGVLDTAAKCVLPHALHQRPRSRRDSYTVLTGDEKNLWLIRWRNWEYGILKTRLLYGMEGTRRTFVKARR